MKRAVIALAAVLAIALAGCEKVSVDCVYTIKPYLQAEDQGEVDMVSEVVSYVFYADTAQWAVADYAGAQAGVLTSRSGSGTKSYDMSALQDEAGLLAFDAVTRKPVLIVVCNKAGQCYAWRQVPMEAGIPKIEVSLVFRPWKTGSPYLESYWTMVNPPKEEVPQEEEPQE